MNVVDDRLLLSLTCISEFNHAEHMMSVVEAVKKLMYHSKALLFKEWTNCFTMRSPLVFALLQVYIKWAICCLEFPLPSNYWDFGGR